MAKNSIYDKTKGKKRKIIKRERSEANMKKQKKKKKRGDERCIFYTKIICKKDSNFLKMAHETNENHCVVVVK